MKLVEHCYNYYCLTNHLKTQWYKIAIRLMCSLGQEFGHDVVGGTVGIIFP